MRRTALRAMKRQRFIMMLRSERLKGDFIKREESAGIQGADSGFALQLIIKAILAGKQMLLLLHHACIIYTKA